MSLGPTVHICSLQLLTSDRFALTINKSQTARSDDLQRGKTESVTTPGDNACCASKLLAVTDEVHDDCAVRGLLVSIAIATLP